MAKQLDPVIADTLKEYGFGKDAAWDCHGVWVVYHRVLEQIAAKAGIVFDPPQIIEAKGEHGIAAVCVTGRLGDVAIWSIGEAAPKNNKNAYPWAMAEKRAVDRVVLKLIGLHGLAYSEEEADDFKPPPKKDQGTWHGPLGISELKKKMKEFAGDLHSCTDAAQLNGLIVQSKAVLEQCERDLPDWYFGDGGDIKGVQHAILTKTAELNQGKAA